MGISYQHTVTHPMPSLSASVPYTHDAATMRQSFQLYLFKYNLINIVHGLLIYYVIGHYMTKKIRKYSLARFLKKESVGHSLGSYF